MSTPGAQRVEIVQGASPHEVRDPLVRAEFKRASVWLGTIAAMAMVVLLIQPLLIIFAAMVFATILDGGVRLLGRVLKIGRGWRLTIVVVCAVSFVLGTFYETGVQVAEQVTELRTTLVVQGDKLLQWLGGRGIVPSNGDVNNLLREAAGQLGKLTSYVGTALGALTTLFLILVLGLFLAMEPRLYERGLQWMIPVASRREFALTIEQMGVTLRRLMAGRLVGMAIEGVLVFVILTILGVPMGLVLGIIAGILAFIPNIGAFITGVLMTAVGFSAGVHTGLMALVTYLVVQTVDGYVVIPMVARRTVDLPPALTLAMQLLASALFGVLGLMLADPMTAMIKVALERSSERAERGEDTAPA